MYSSVSNAMTECCHEVQFYDQDSYLIEKLGQYVEEGLALGESVLLLTTPSHSAALNARLTGTPDPTRFRQIDAAQILTQFMVSEWPDREKFQDVMGQLIQQAGGGNRRVRIFGEMVMLLWERGQSHAALHLEFLWNQLAAHHTFSLLCAYPLRGFADHTHTQAFQKICSMHTGVKPAENAMFSEPGRVPIQIRSWQTCNKKLSLWKPKWCFGKSFSIGLFNERKNWLNFWKMPWNVCTKSGQTGKSFGPINPNWPC